MNAPIQVGDQVEFPTYHECGSYVMRRAEVTGINEEFAVVDLPDGTWDVVPRSRLTLIGR